MRSISNTVSLRPWTPNDAGHLAAALRLDPELRRQFACTDSDTPAATAAWFAEHLGSSPTELHLAIVVDGVPSGDVALSRIDRGHDTAWVSYWLAPPVRGRGLATRAVATLCDLAFGDGLHRLELPHRVNNPASCVVARAAGFRVEGLQRDKLRYGSERFDVETHARLATDPAPVHLPIAVLHP